MRITFHQKLIINKLRAAQRRLTTRQVAQNTGLAWMTVRHNLVSLLEGGYVRNEILSNRTYWWLNPEKSV